MISSAALTALLVSVSAAAGGLDGTDPSPSTPSPFTTVKIYLSEPGVYRVGFDELTAAGLELPALPADQIGVSNAGEDVPIWIEHGGDGELGPGDWIELVGRRLPGEIGYYNEYSPINVYLLHWDGSHLRRQQPAARQPEQSAQPCKPSYLVREHLEEDQLLLRFAGQQRDEELWFWQRLCHLDQAPFTTELQLPGLDRESDQEVLLRVHLRGWSRTPRRLGQSPADHHVDILLNQQVIGSVEWDGQDEAVGEARLPAAQLQLSGDQLALSVPRRLPEPEADPLIDVVLLNWIELTYPRHGGIGPSQVRMELDQGCGEQPVRLFTPANSRLVVYDDQGTRIAAPRLERRPVPGGGFHHLFFLAPGSSFWVVPDGALRAPLALEPDRPAGLTAPGNQADYLVITHPDLGDAITPLVSFHRERGLTVAVVDITDVYDELNHGILHPRAIKDFISFAYHHWTPPAPRFVLLVGDASWDTKNEEAQNQSYVSWTYSSGRQALFPATQGTPYEHEEGRNNRNLIPTWSYLTREGHAASDNYFVAVDGDDELPDLAIGRLAVTRPEEVAAIVDKTVRYSTSRHVGPWRRRLLWISDGESYMDRMSDRLASNLAKVGYAALKVKPLKSDPDNEQHRQRLRDAFNAGQALVHFVGHGGRFIWRTAPADLEKNRDLFTLEDVDRLEPHLRLPIVVSMTCYSAPFDHPSSDSIGEKFLRAEQRGAVAVIAASWRISPSLQTSQLLISKLTQPGTVGEAVMVSKREAGHHDFLHIFNLLGDPALPLQPPAADLELSFDPADPLTLTLTLPGDPGPAAAICELIDAAGEVVAAEQATVSNGSCTVSFTGDAARLATVTHARAYVWSEGTGQDWLRAVPVGTGDG